MRLWNNVREERYWILRGNIVREERYQIHWGNTVHGEQYWSHLINTMHKVRYLDACGKIHARGTALDAFVCTLNERFICSEQLKQRMFSELDVYYMGHK